MVVGDVITVVVVVGSVVVVVTSFVSVVVATCVPIMSVDKAMAKETAIFKNLSNGG